MSHKRSFIHEETHQNEFSFHIRTSRSCDGILYITYG